MILNSDDDSISVIDTLELQGDLPQLHRPGAAPPDADAGREQTLIIAMAGGNELVFIDRESGQVVKRRLEASDPYQVGFSPDAKWFVATSLRLDRIDIYDGKDYTGWCIACRRRRCRAISGSRPTASTAYITCRAPTV